ncbi:MAG: hypothetical protein ABIK89_24620 [Planctomycetota bacterium]
MTSRRSFYRKIAYLVFIGLLLLPLSYLSQPATNRAKEGQGGRGGVLAQLRAEYKLSEAQLGEIDPTSETLKLATFGMRGVAANVLWGKAKRYDMKKDWTNLSATLEQIAKLEPHFIPVWRYQAWRVSYNVSSEFDDYRGRYRWVIKGIDFLKEGIRYNENEPVLYSDVGWFTAQKIGRADEHKQFRRLFKEDDDFHGSRPPELRDNWLVGKESFLEAEKLVEGGASLRKVSPVLFYSQAPMCQMNHSEALEEDGIFEEKARIAWNRAGREWDAFGNREIPTSFPGIIIRLNGRAESMKDVEDLRAQFEALVPPGLREEVAERRKADLTDSERQTMEIPVAERTEEQHRAAAEAGRKLQVTDEQLAEQLTGAQRSSALELAKALAEADRLTTIIGRYQEVVNYEFWARRAQIEQTPQALLARKRVYEAHQAFAEQTNLQLAKTKYEEGLASWRELLDAPQFPGLVQDANLGEELMETIQMYRGILDACDEPFPKDFILQDIVDLHKHRLDEPWEEE